MAMPSSQKIRSESEMVPELRPVMPADLFRAVMKGDSDVLIRRLGLQPEEQTEIQVTIEASYSALEERNAENQTVYFNLQSATLFGDTIPHLLIIEGHNELALMVFQRDMSLLKARNNMLETPLHSAAKVGNEMVIHNLIQSDLVVVKEALEERNINGDTALHVAVKHGYIDICWVLINLDRKLAYKVNDEMKSPLYMAIIEGHTVMVQTMLQADPALACTPFSDGMFPVHEAARMGNLDLVKHFIEKYPDDAELRDPRGRNFFHIAAGENQKEIFSGLFKDAMFREMVARMNYATNYEGNTPFHIAAMEGHTLIMRAIWINDDVAETIQNKHGLTPFELSVRHLLETNENIDRQTIGKYMKAGGYGYRFTSEWFDLLEPIKEIKVLEKAQIIGLGSVLITTVTFAAAFTLPGGYNQDQGAPIFGRRYMFRAFILANALAFIQGFLSLCALLTEALTGLTFRALKFARRTFLLAASSMVVTFGLGLYVTIAPVCLPIAIFLLVITLFVGSPAVISVVGKGQHRFEFSCTCCCTLSAAMITYAVSCTFIFCMALIT